MPVLHQPTGSSEPGHAGLPPIPAYPGGYGAPELLRRIGALRVMCRYQQSLTVGEPLGVVGLRARG